MSTNSKNKATESAQKADAKGEKSRAYGDKPVSADEVENTMILDPNNNVEMQREVIVMKKWNDGTIYFIDPNHLDAIDRKRMLRALGRANKVGVELWTVLKDTSLSNGANGLDFFHQYVQTYRPTGAVRAPDAARLQSVVSRDRDLAIERARPQLIRKG